MVAIWVYQQQHEPCVAAATAAGCRLALRPAAELACPSQQKSTWPRLLV